MPTLACGSPGVYSFIVAPIHSLIITGLPRCAGNEDTVLVIHLKMLVAESVACLSPSRSYMWEVMKSMGVPVLPVA